jgi:serine acetyltransferase
VVAHDVPAGAVVVGNPAKFIKMIADLKYDMPAASGADQPYEHSLLRAAS